MAENGWFKKLDNDKKEVKQDDKLLEDSYEIEKAFSEIKQSYKIVLDESGGLILPLSEELFGDGTKNFGKIEELNKHFKMFPQITKMSIGRLMLDTNEKSQRLVEWYQRYVEFLQKFIDERGFVFLLESSIEYIKKLENELEKIKSEKEELLNPENQKQKKSIETFDIYEKKISPLVKYYEKKFKLFTEGDRDKTEKDILKLAGKNKELRIKIQAEFARIRNENSEEE
jgi:ribosomal protein S15P/S13E